jgi:hypothetical protein
LHEAGLGVVTEVAFEDLVAETPFGGRVVDGEEDFAAFVEVAGHPVGGAAEDFFGAAVGEPEDAAVLEEAADDGADADIFAESGDAGAKGAHAADDEVDLDSGCGGSVEGFDGAGVEQAVHLGDDAGGLAGAGVLGFAGDECEGVASEGKRGDEEGAVSVFRGLPAGGEVAEDAEDGFGDLGASGEEADVGVKAGGDGVIVPGAEMGVAADGAVRVFADDEG